MRRLLGVLLFCSSLLLVAAAPPTPSPVITPASTPPPMQVVTPPPVNRIPSVIVFPFDVQSGQDAKIGTAIAQILNQEMTSAGGMNVMPVPSGIPRARFGEYSRQQRADFYIAGFVTPVGDGAAVVDQVVSVESGVIVYSNTAQVNSVADVAAQAVQQRSAIFAIVGRNAESMQAESSETPAPTSSNGANVPLKGIANIVDSVFGAKHKPGKGPSPSPMPSAKPQRGVIVAPATWSGSGVSASDLTAATTELNAGLSHFYATKTTAAVPNVAKAADAICGANRDNTVATGILGQTSSHHHTQYAFTLQVYTCFGALLDGVNGSGPTVKKAVDTAIAAYAEAHPDNN